MMKVTNISGRLKVVRRKRGRFDDGASQERTSPIVGVHRGSGYGFHSKSLLRGL